MPLISEYAFTPNVFEKESYSSEEVAFLYFQDFKNVLLNQAIVRNLRNGEWLKTFNDNNKSWHLRAKELLKKLVKQNRLNLFPAVLSDTPQNDDNWCREALASHEKEPLDGIITSDEIVCNYKDIFTIVSFNKLSTTQWWKQGPSVRPERTIEAYMEHLRIILQCANSIMFIDPHLDPTRRGYRKFVKLIEMICTRKRHPLIEIHRVCYEGSGPGRQIIDFDEWKNRFNSLLQPVVSKADLSIEVSIWDDFHDRCMISDLIGVSLSNGFDVSSKLDDITTWTRLSRIDRDDLQREFDPVSGRHKRQGCFLIS
jgi:hypothetical protein